MARKNRSSRSTPSMPATDDRDSRVHHADADAFDADALAARFDRLGDAALAHLRDDPDAAVDALVQHYGWTSERAARELAHWRSDQALAQAKATVTAGLDRAKGAAGDAVDELRAAADAVRRGTHAAGERLAGDAAAATHALLHRAEAGLEGARELVRRHPLATVGVALAAGYILFRRRR